MKYISKIIVFLSLISIISCNKDENNTENTNFGWIEFSKNSDDTASSTESMAIDKIVKIPVEVHVPVYEDGLIINYKFESISGPNPSTIFSNDGKLVVPNNQGGLAIENGHPYITLNIGETIPLNENIVFDIVLTGTNKSNIVAGIENSETLRPIKHRVKICSSNLQAFIGTYTVSEEFISGTNSGLQLSSAFGESYQVEILAQPGDTTGTKFIINNTSGYDTYYADGTILTLDNSVIVFDNGNPMVAGFRIHEIEETSFSHCDRTLTIIGQLGNFGTYRTILTKQ